MRLTPLPLVALAALALDAPAGADEVADEDAAETSGTGVAAGASSVAAAAATAVARTAHERRSHQADPVLGGADPISGGEAHGVVAFTFDDGPRPATTGKVIDALVAYDVPAAFFVVGKRLVGKRSKAARALLARMVAEGFEIGSHTYDHPNLRRIDDKKMAWQIDRTSRVLHDLLGAPIGLFRPPYGSHSKKSAAHVARTGLTSVLWNIDSVDWRKPKADRMRKAIVDAIFRKDGGVVLMHDTKQLTAQNIRGILDDLEAGNCARLKAGEHPVVPVSLHYFLKDGDQRRAIPAEIEARTQRYRDRLPERCATREDGSRSNGGANE